MNFKDYFALSIGAGQENEDAILSLSHSQSRIVILCDGMSGYGFGKLASDSLLSSIHETFKEVIVNENLPAKQIIQQLLENADQQILLKRRDLRSKFGATTAGLYCQKAEYWVFWIGDVRVYHLRGDEVLSCTSDQSLANANLNLAEKNKAEHIVTASISGRGITKLQIKLLTVKIGDRIIICTDGFWRKADVQNVINMSDEDLDKYLNKANTFDDDRSIIRFTID